MAPPPAPRRQAAGSHGPTAIPGRRVLVAAGRADVVARVAFLAASDGHAVATACRGDQALAELRKASFDLLVLGPPLPDIEWHELLRRAQIGELAARAEQPRDLTIGILVLLDSVESTAEAAERIAVLTAGADDVLRVSLSDRELQLRMAAILRRVLPRALAARERALRIGPLRVDPAALQAMVNEHLLTLTATEFRLLHTLALRAHGIEPRAVLMQSLRGAPSTRSERALTAHLSRLRRKLEPMGITVDSVRGAGSRLRSV